MFKNTGGEKQLSTEIEQFNDHLNFHEFLIHLGQKYGRFIVITNHCNYTFLLGSKNWTRRIYKKAIHRAQVISTTIFSSFSQGKCLWIYNIYWGEGGGQEKKIKTEHSSRCLLRLLEEIVVNLALCDYYSSKDNFLRGWRISEEWFMLCF